MSDRITPLQVPSLMRSRSPSPNRDPRTLYFAYGTNLWHKQMKQRCPSSHVIGLGRLRHWRWHINTKGVANILENPASPSPLASWLGPLGSSGSVSSHLREDRDRVYGVIYRLEKEDERALDEVQRDCGYEKESAMVEFWSRGTDADGAVVLPNLAGGRIQKVRVVMYVDRLETMDGKPSGSYLYKVQAGIRDGLAEGIPQSYFDKYVKPYLPDEEGEKSLVVAIQEAIKQGVDVKKILDKAESDLAASEDVKLKTNSNDASEESEAKMKTNGNHSTTSHDAEAQTNGK